MSKICLGLMGFGRIGRQIYRLSLDDERFEVAAISDIGRPNILHHLLTKEAGSKRGVLREGNYLVSPRGRTRLTSADRPDQIPWDVFGVDVVIDATGRFRSRRDLTPHLDNGARRVIVSTLPEDSVDRLVLYGVNHEQAVVDDRIVSAGSATTAAAALALQTLCDAHPVAHATMTSVHAYTSDQTLQDYAGPDYRRSRSGAENIIPNETPSLHWVQQVLPAMAGKLSGYALNVPVRVGSLLDLTVVLEQASADVAAVNALFVAASQAQPRLIGTTEDPIVSSDVKHCSQSLLVDLAGTMQGGERMIKVLAWYETLGHARRILDVAALYGDLDGARKEVS